MLDKDSILGFTDNKEFVVYDPAQVYPEYIMWAWCWRDGNSGGENLGRKIAFRFLGIDIHFWTQIVMLFILPTFRKWGVFGVFLVVPASWRWIALPQVLQGDDFVTLWVGQPACFQFSMWKEKCGENEPRANFTRGNGLILKVKQTSWKSPNDIQRQDPQYPKVCVVPAMFVRVFAFFETDLWKWYGLCSFLALGSRHEKTRFSEATRLEMSTLSFKSICHPKSLCRMTLKEHRKT